MSEVAEDVQRNDADRLLTNGRFLEERFGASSLSLEPPATARAKSRTSRPQLNLVPASGWLSKPP